MHLITKIAFLELSLALFKAILDMIRNKEIISNEKIMKFITQI